MLNNGTVSQLAWVTPCLDRIRCELRWSVIGGSGALVLPDHSLIVGCVCVKGWGMNQHLSLAVGMVVGLVLVWERLYTPAGLLIYCNSRALGHEHALWGSLQCRVSRSSWKIELMIHDHFTYAISLMYALEIIDAMSFASYNLIMVDAFYAKLNTMTYPCY